jgi:NADPH-dependent 2,4-dienoyl-CoA reductase/sulfur reductase-like enzyme
LSRAKKIIVVGGNAAGPAAAAKAKRVDPSAEVYLYEAGNFISTGTCELPYVLSGQIDYKDIIFYSPESFFEEKKVWTFTNHSVEAVDKSKKVVRIRNLIDDSTNIENYDKLVLTTGSLPKRVPQISTNLKNVFYLKSVNDYLKIKDYLVSNSVKQVLIIGAGYIGLESADAFKSLSTSVTLIDKAELPLPTADKEIQHLVLNVLKNNNVEFIGNCLLGKIKIEDEKIRSVDLNNKYSEFDLVLVAAGVAPNSSLAASAGLEIGLFDGIKVDNKLRTSDHNIFAAGDNTEVINKVTGKKDYFPLATVAHTYGHIAGANSAGGNFKANPIIKNIAFKLFSNAVCIVGLCSNEASINKFNYLNINAVAPNLVKVMPQSKNTFGKIIYDSKSKYIYGASFIGGREVIEYGNIISMMISNKIYAHELQSINYNYTPPLSPFVNLLSILGRKIKR